MYLRVSITERCNLRCRYCLPERARFRPAAASAAELRGIMRAICEAVAIDKIRLTGGEPTLHPECLQFVRDAKALVPTVGMTSNGMRLAPLLPALRTAGLDLINISLDAANETDFQAVTRRPGFGAVLASIRAGKALGYDPVKVNVVVMQSTDVVALVELARREGVHLRFIELMAVGQAQAWHARQYLAATSIQRRLMDAGFSLWSCPEDDLPTSRVWHLGGSDPAQCTLGFITTSSEPFCESCDRIRLTSQGRLHTCLFDERGHDLLTCYRSGDAHALREEIQRAVAGKAPPAHFQRRAVMAAIGG